MTDTFITPSKQCNYSGTSDRNGDDSSGSKAFPAVWDWRYESKDTKIRALYKKAVSEQWQADNLNWNYVIDPTRELLDPTRNALIDFEFLRPLSKTQREEFVALSMADSLSQILHGEQSGIIVGSRLAQILPELDAKTFAVSQAMDEARHVEVFSKYARRLDAISPPVETLTRILNKVMGARHWQGMLIGINVMVEGLALTAFANFRGATNCDLLREILKLIMRDESRHVAFGNTYLKSVLADMHVDDRAEVEDFTADLVADYRQWGHHIGDWQTIFDNLVKIGVDPRDYLAKVRSNLALNGTVDIEPKMMRGIESFVMPTLKRLGLITDRVLPRYLASEIESSKQLAALDELELSFLA